MSADINIVKFNQDFLLSLKRKQNFSSKNIKLKFTRYIKGEKYTETIASVEGISSRYPDVLLSKKARECMYGDLSSITEVLITNNNLPFFNEFKLSDIDGTLRISDRVRYNGLNKSFYSEEIERFKKQLISIFKKYIINLKATVDLMNACYVNACYVDNNYNCENTEALSSPAILYPDIDAVEAGVHAGPGDNWIGFPTGAPLYISDFPLNITGATYTGFPGTTVLWTITDATPPYPLNLQNDKLIISNSRSLTPTLSLNGPLSGNTIINSYAYMHITLTVTYPWGLTLSDDINITPYLL